jgi:hypothetical protein
MSEFTDDEIAFSARMAIKAGLGHTVVAHGAPGAGAAAKVVGRAVPAAASGARQGEKTSNGCEGNRQGAAVSLNL